MSLNTTEADVGFTEIDLNDTNTTSTVYDPNTDGEIYGVFMENGGSTAEVQLEVTDGTDTAVLAVPGAGNDLAFSETIRISTTESLQINVTTAEGAAQTNTAAVSRSE